VASAAGEAVEARATPGRAEAARASARAAAPAVEERRRLMAVPLVVGRSFERRGDPRTFGKSLVEER
jgi:hypothetical protein